MIQISLKCEWDDDQEFVDGVNRIVSGAVARHQPAEFCVFKIDNWFGHKWLAFSGKLLGAVGSWRDPLTVPPFVANRIVGQCYFKQTALTREYHLESKHLKIHHRGSAEENLLRPVQRICPGCALFWYSGNTKSTGRGSLMGYLPVEGEIWPWFLAFVRNGDWRVSHRKSIHEYELRLFASAGEDSIADSASEAK